MQAIDKIEGLNIGHGTHEGMSGKHNEDSYGFFGWDSGAGKPLYIGVVADGVGGQTAGEVASSLAVEAVRNYFRRQEKINSNLSAHLERAILAANKAVYEYSQGHSEVSGMGTTMVLVAIFEQKLYTAYVGDSRIYLYREGKLQQITVDHTWAQEAIQVGLLTREQAKTHPNRNVIKRFLGGFPEVEVDHRLVIDPEIIGDEAKANQGLLLQPGDIVLLNSDGLSDMIDDGVIQDSLNTYSTQLQSGVHDLINKANLGGGRDNITALVLQIPPRNKTANLATGRMPRMATTPMSSSAMASAVAAAAQTAQAAPTASPAPVTVTEEHRRSVLPWVMVLAGLLLVIILIIVAAVIGLNALNRDDQTDAPTTTTPSTTNVPGQQTTPGPATLGVLNGTIENTPNSSETDTTPSLAEPTLGLIPTYTNTPTPLIPTATPRPSITPTPTETYTPVPGGGGGGGSSQPATNTPPPGSTSPPPTNTSAPPTNTVPPPPTNTVPPPPTNTPSGTLCPDRDC